MANYRGFDLFDYVLLVVKRKKFFLLFFLFLLIVSYLAVYFLIPPEYDSTAIIVSSEEQNFSPIASLTKSISNLPLSSFGLGSLSANDKYDLFTTFIYSRTNLVDLIKHFDLLNDYHLKKMDKVVKILKDKITTDITDQNAYTISVRASSPKKSAEMTNYLVDKINNDVINFNIQKAKENKIFLQERVEQIRTQLKNSEDSLKLYQKSSGFFEAEDQTKAIINFYSDLEEQLTTKELEAKIMSKLYGEKSSQSRNANLYVEELRQKINEIKKGEGSKDFSLSIKSLPDEVAKYLRYFREIKINETLLEFVYPMFEQAKYEEEKDVPVLQVIDRAVPPEKKSFPPRGLFTIIISIIVFLIVSFSMFMIERFKTTENKKLLLIKKELFNFRNKKD